MNKVRRKIVKEIIDDMIKFLEDIHERIEKVQTDEEFAYDSMPENLQNSLRGQESSDVIDCFQEAIDNIEDTIAILQEI